LLCCFPLTVLSITLLISEVNNFFDLF
jgi:hypothetical protein